MPFFAFGRGFLLGAILVTSCIILRKIGLAIYVTALDQLVVSAKCYDPTAVENDYLVRETGLENLFEYPSEIESFIVKGGAER